MNKILTYGFAILASSAALVACDDDDDTVSPGLYDATPAASAAGTYAGSCYIEPIGSLTSKPSTANCSVSISEVPDKPYIALISVSIEGQENIPWTDSCNIVHTANGFDLSNFVSTSLAGAGYAVYVSPEGELTTSFTKTAVTYIEVENPFTGEMDKEAKLEPTRFTISCKK